MAYTFLNVILPKKKKNPTRRYPSLKTFFKKSMIVFIIMKVIKIKIKTVQEPGAEGKNAFEVYGGLFFPLNWVAIKCLSSCYSLCFSYVLQIPFETAQ